MTPVDVRPALIIAMPDGCGMKRLLRGNHSKAVNVAEGSAADVPQLKFDAVDLPVELACNKADGWVRHVR